VTSEKVLVASQGRGPHPSSFHSILAVAIGASTKAIGAFTFAAAAKALALLIVRAAARVSRVPDRVAKEGTRLTSATAVGAETRSRVAHVRCCATRGHGASAVISHAQAPVGATLTTPVHVAPIAVTGTHVPAASIAGITVIVVTAAVVVIIMHDSDVLVGSPGRQLIAGIRLSNTIADKAKLLRLTALRSAG